MAELGRGAASIIYLVQDLKSKQVWALKHVVKETAKDLRFIEQAEREFEVASKLDHPVIRKIFKVLKKKQNLLSVSDLWLVMEVVDGASLEREPPNTFESAAAIFEQVARGMAYMHSQGYVHADMKPNNIIVDDEGTCKVIDLGQSCKIGTVKERIQGTPDYIAPEQVHRRAITEKTDIYNLGATMYWALTRQFVPTALTAAKSDSLVSHKDDRLMERPKRPQEHNSRVPDMFDKLIMDCVEIDAGKRPRTMLDVADKLNFIYAKLLAEQELRRSGMLPKFGEAPKDPGPAAKPAAGPKAIGATDTGAKSHGDSVDMGIDEIGDLPNFDSFDEDPDAETELPGSNGKRPS